jgi:hypothetical protein
MYKSTHLFSTLPRSKADLNLFQKPGSAMNILSLDSQASNIQGNQDIKSTPNHFLISASLFPFNRMKNMGGKLFSIVCLQGLLGVHQAYAATYYVSPNGTDSNSGTSLSEPVKTIKKALSKASSSGDIVYVTTGTYAETVYIGQSGITLSAYGDNKPVIDGGSSLPNVDWGKLIYVMGNNNTVSGFEVKNSNSNGSYRGGNGVQVDGHHNTISKMNIHHNWDKGIRILGDYTTVEDSTIWQNARSNSANPGSSGWGSGIAAARNTSSAAIKPGITSYAVLRRNKVFNNWGEGLACWEADHCTLEDNVVYDNWTNNLYLSDATNSLVNRNMVYISSSPAIPFRDNKPAAGIALADEVGSAPRSAYNSIINNFIYNASFSAFRWTLVNNSGLNNVLIANNTIVDGGLSTGSGGSYSIVNTSSQIRNNIILGKNSAIPSNSGITFSNNNWAATPSAAASSTDIAGDPQVARTGTMAPGALTPAYFQLLSSSPVINAATTLNSVTKDFFQSARGTAPDIGGHEFISNSSPSSSSSPDTGANSSSDTCTQVALSVSGAASDGGYSSILFYSFGTQADNNNFIKQSTLRFFENGVEIGPAHSAHADIRNKGAGRFSHWSNTDGTGESIRFSASDNSNPRTNGKKYSYCLI